MTRQANRIQVIIFDLDGTLVDSSRDITTSMNQTLAHYGYPPLTVKQCIRHVGGGIANTVSRAFGASAHNDPLFDWDADFIQQAVKTFRKNYDQYFLKTTAPYPGVQETIEQLTPLKLAMISNKAYTYSYKIMARFGLTRHFDIILGGDSLKTKKPDPGPIQYVLQRLSVTPQKSLVVGDSDNDIRAGQAARTSTCAVTFGMRSPAELAQLNPDFMIDQFKELLDLPIIKTG